jgi:hypothetical protein
MGLKARYYDFKKKPGTKRFLRFIRPHRMSAYQLLVTLFLANLPIIVTYLVKIITAKPEDHGDYMAPFWAIFKAGDVFVYSAALVAPFGWTVLEYIRKKKGIWLAPIPLFLSFLCTLVGAIIYALSESGLALNRPLISTLASTIFMGSVAVLYWSVYSDRALNEPEIDEPFEKDEDDINTILAKMDKAG